MFVEEVQSRGAKGYTEIMANAKAKSEIAKWAHEIVETWEQGCKFLGSRDPAEHVDYAIEGIFDEADKVHGMNAQEAAEALLKEVRKLQAR